MIRIRILTPPSSFLLSLYLFSDKSKDRKQATIVKERKKKKKTYLFCYTRHLPRRRSPDPLSGTH